MKTQTAQKRTYTKRAAFWNRKTRGKEKRASVAGTRQKRPYTKRSAFWQGKDGNGSAPDPTPWPKVTARLVASHRGALESGSYRVQIASANLHPGNHLEVTLRLLPA
jgi:hypothetical protein